MRRNIFIPDEMEEFIVFTAKAKKLSVSGYIKSLIAVEMNPLSLDEDLKEIAFKNMFELEKSTNQKLDQFFNFFYFWLSSYYAHTTPLPKELHETQAISGVERTKKLLMNYIEVMKLDQPDIYSRIMADLMEQK